MRSSSGPDSRAWYSVAQRGPRRHAPAPGPPPQRHGGVAFFPTGKLRISSRLPDPFSGEPVTLADHLIRCRKQRGLLQREAAAIMGVCTESVSQWEAGGTPADRLWPRVVGFLGYDPSPPPTSGGERLKLWRRRQGLSIGALSRAVRCDEATLAKWEKDRALPAPQHGEALDAILRRYWCNSVESCALLAELSDTTLAEADAADGWSRSMKTRQASIRCRSCGAWKTIGLPIACSSKSA